MSARCAELRPLCVYQAIQGMDLGSSFRFIIQALGGRDLLQYMMSARPFTEEDAESLITKVGDAVLYMHEHGIAHRDIKVSDACLSSTLH